MSKPSPMAGGFFLVAPIVAGFFWGLGSGRAMQGVILGAALGILLALIVWLIDRARQRR
jgi:mannose/fructose/N-acetylgalactosamine-specific phosphotransferase system component IIC